MKSLPCLLLVFFFVSIQEHEVIGLPDDKRISALSEYIQFSKIRTWISCEFLLLTLLPECEEYVSLIKVPPSCPRMIGYPCPKEPVLRCDPSHGLLVGGPKAKSGELPHMAAIGYRTISQDGPSKLDFVCGGSLISESHVLTAASCYQRFVFSSRFNQQAFQLSCTLHSFR